LDLFAIVEKFKKENPIEYYILTKVPVKFSYENDGKHYEYLRPTIVESLNDTFNIFYSPPFQGPLHADPLMVDEFYRSFAIFESLINDKRYLYTYLLKEGDLVLFANRRVLHGREAFDNSGDRWLKGTYVPWDDLKNKFRVHLKNKPDFSYFRLLSFTENKRKGPTKRNSQ
jgi:gamma-butyrobetaine dioxygenase